MIRRRKVAERGQGIVEFAVIFPVFVLAVFLMIDGGLLMGHYGQVNHAVKEGARLGATGGDEDEIIARVVLQANGLLDDPGDFPRNCQSSGNAQICVRWYDGPNGEDAGQTGSLVRVHVHYHYFYLTPIDQGIFGITGIPNHISVDACTVATLERPVSGDWDESSGSPACP